MERRLPLYPVNLVLEGRRCLVVGGGQVAASKAAELLACGAEVHVVAIEVGDEVRALAAGTASSSGIGDGSSVTGTLSWEERPYRAGTADEPTGAPGEPGEAADYRFVVAATDDPEVNRAVRVDAENAGVWVNSADDPANCTVMLPGRIRRGSLLVTFSTGGVSPASTRWLRERFEELIGPEYGILVDMAAAERARLIDEGRRVAPDDWQRALDSGMFELIREGRLAEAKERLQACLSSSSD